MKLLTALTSCLLLTVSGAQEVEQAGDEQQIRVLPECVRLDGSAMNWGDAAGRSLLLYFHRGGMDYSTRGLRDVVDLLAASPKLAASTALVIVSFQKEGLEAARMEADVPGLVTRVVYDEGRHAFSGYRVVAFPTAYVLDPERREIHHARGYGPHFDFRLRTALLRSSGVIDEAEFRLRMDGKSEVELSVEAQRLVRVCGLARAMVRKGQAAAGLTLLEEALAAVDVAAVTEFPGALELAVRLNLRIHNGQRAAGWLQTLEQADPEAKVLPLLRCRMKLHARDTDGAEAELKGLRPRLQPEIYLLRGRILEARGEFKKAARLYREQLEQLTLGGQALKSDVDSAK
jgi:hypothetical protein